MPVYEKSQYKIAARQANVDIYRSLTGRFSIPAQRGYWTLCNVQSPDARSEINQMVECSLIDKTQFYGVDRDKKIVVQNRKWHPDAHWYDGDWLDVIWKKDFNPALVYLDTTSFADHNQATRLVSRTMMVCPKKTVLLANVMLNDPRSSRQFDSDKLLQNLTREVPPTELRKWNNKCSEAVKNFQYSTTGKTFMLTYVLFKN